MKDQHEQNDVWFTATGEEEGKILIFRSRTKPVELISESDYPNLVSIYWYYETDETGLPDEEINDAQVDFEDALESLDNVAVSFLMLIVTGNARKQWHWYVFSDTETWMKDFNKLLANHPEYPLEIEFTHDPKWDLYHDFISGVENTENITN